MARLTDTERAAHVAEQIAQKQAELHAIQMRQRRRERKEETQRKIVVGGTVLAVMQTDPSFREQMLALLRVRVTRAQDKAAIASMLPSDPPPAKPTVAAAAK
jgi:hypothetical protein